MAALKKGIIGSDRIDWLENRGDWANLNAMDRVERSREIDGVRSVLSVASYLTIWKNSPAWYGGYWGIESVLRAHKLAA